MNKSAMAARTQSLSAAAHPPPPERRVSFYCKHEGLYGTPRITLYQLTITWLGIGRGSKVFISAALPIRVNTIASVRNIDANLLRAARAFCARDRHIFTTDTLMVGVLVTAFAGVLLTSAAARLQRHFGRWRPAHSGGH